MSFDKASTSNSARSGERQILRCSLVYASLLGGATDFVKFSLEKKRSMMKLVPFSTATNDLLQGVGFSGEMIETK